MNRPCRPDRILGSLPGRGRAHGLGAALLALGLPVLLAACGQKGPLVRPSDARAAAHHPAAASGAAAAPASQASAP